MRVVIGGEDPRLTLPPSKVKTDSFPDLFMCDGLRIVPYDNPSSSSDMGENLPKVTLFAVALFIMVQSVEHM